MAVDPFALCGQVIESQFRIDRVVGEGGFSVVYRGHHLGLDEPVAVKCLKLQAHLESDMIQEFARRFRDESRIMYKLSQGHLDIVRSITAGTTVAPSTGALIPYMVLEWLEGRSLGMDLRERRVQGKTGRTIHEIIELFEPAVSAVAFAHAQGVVHRDLKPGNLYLAKTASGIRLKVLDFGLAKIIDPVGGIAPSFQTMGNNTICSPSYGAPEQFDTSVGKIGPWTDVYALGLLVLELLRDKRVRKGDGLAQCALEALSPEQPTPYALGIKLRPQVELALARACAFSPDTRQKSAHDFWDELKRGAERKSITPTADVTLDGSTVLDPSSWKDDLASTRVGQVEDVGTNPVINTPPPASADSYPAGEHSYPAGEQLNGTLVIDLVTRSGENAPLPESNADAIAVPVSESNRPTTVRGSGPGAQQQVTAPIPILQRLNARPSAPSPPSSPTGRSADSKRVDSTLALHPTDPAPPKRTTVPMYASHDSAPPDSQAATTVVAPNKSGSGRSSMRALPAPFSTQPGNPSLGPGRPSVALLVSVMLVAVILIGIATAVGAKIFMSSKADAGTPALQAP